MKKIMYVLIVLFMLSPLTAWAETFLGAPLPEGGTVVSQTEKKVITTYAMPYADVIAFYKETLKKLDCKFKNRGESMFIEEYTALPWHSIWIEKTGDGTKITVTKDSWMWIMSTLTLRFFAVFIVLIGLFLPLTLIGFLVKRAQAKEAAAKA